MRDECCAMFGDPFLKNRTGCVDPYEEYDWRHTMAHWPWF
jgi:hypothetical protein